MKKNIRYCYLAHDFPKFAWLVTLFILSTDDETIIQTLTLTSLFTNLDELTLDIKQLIHESETEGKVKVSEYVSILPVSLESLYPLKKEYWQSPNTHVDSENKNSLLRKAVVNYSFYKLLVTPSSDTTPCYFYAALPFYKTSNSNSVIETFMLTSDWPVPTSAKYAAIYTLGIPKRYNYVTKEISEIYQKKDEKSKSIKQVN